MKMLTKQLVAARYSVTERTIDRWAESGFLPSPMRINTRCYWDEAEIEQRERDRKAAAQQSTAAETTTA